MTIAGLVRALPSFILEPCGSRSPRCSPPTMTPSAGLPPPRSPDRVILDKLVQLLVFGGGYRRIADHTCSATTLRRRRDEWISAAVAEQLRLAVLAADDAPTARGLSPTPGDETTVVWMPCRTRVDRRSCMSSGTDRRRERSSVERPAHGPPCNRAVRRSRNDRAILV